jgi:hypothetical protein
MASSLDDYIEKKLISGFSTFTRAEALAELPLSPDVLISTEK